MVSWIIAVASCRYETLVSAVIFTLLDRINNKFLLFVLCISSENLWRNCVWNCGETVCRNIQIYKLLPYVVFDLTFMNDKIQVHKKIIGELYYRLIHHN